MLVFSLVVVLVVVLVVLVVGNVSFEPVMCGKRACVLSKNRLGLAAHLSSYDFVFSYW